MKNKITNKFKPRDCTYKLGKTYYLSQPKNTYVRYYLREDDVYVAILRRHTNIMPIAAIICIIIYIVAMSKKESSEVNIKYSDTMYIQKGLLTLDLLNVSDSDVEYVVYLESNKISNGILEENSSKSNVICNTDLGNGSYHGVLKIKSLGIETKKNILIVIDNDL